MRRHFARAMAAQLPAAAGGAATGDGAEAATGVICADTGVVAVVGVVACTSLAGAGAGATEGEERAGTVGADAPRAAMAAQPLGATTGAAAGDGADTGALLGALWPTVLLCFPATLCQAEAAGCSTLVPGAGASGSVL